MLDPETQKAFTALFHALLEKTTRLNLRLDTIQEILKEAGICDQKKLDKVLVRLRAEDDQSLAVIRDELTRTLKEFGYSIDEDDLN